MRTDTVNESPLVSVIMNCYNGETYLREAIDSVYAQTYQNWEIIFWDNASTDRSAEIALSYGDRLKYFRGEETILLGAARKKALGQANGELIAFLDCDDLWLPDKLEKQVKAMNNEKYALCYGGHIQIDGDGNELGVYIPKHKSGYLFNELLVQFDIAVPTVVLRKAVLIESGLTFDENIAASEEYCLFMQLAVDYPFCILREVIAKYRTHNKSLTWRSIGEWAKEREYTLALIRKNHPGIEEKYCSGFKIAYARARYYRARYYVSRGEKLKAIKELRQNVFVDYRYLFLFILLFMPTPVWNLVHKMAHKQI